MNKKSLEIRKIIIDAYYDLLQTDLYNQITVTQVCQVSHVSRRTFYRHFENPNEILNVVFKEKGRQFQLHCDQQNYVINKQNVTYDEMLQAYKRFFVFWDNLQNHHFLKILQKQNLLHYFSDFYIRYEDFLCVQYDLDQFEKGTLIYQYYPGIANAIILNVLDSWAKRDFIETIDDLAKIMMDANEIFSKYKK